ncbi:MAG: hypothetical protein KJI72_02000 [Patescibacteria group bacterium]|nr:hypothetical protein [Patescibacteria group bacterium]
MSGPANPETKEVHGHTFEFVSEGKPEVGLHPHWRSIGANSVFIFPPHGQRESWTIWSPYPNLCVHSTGEDAEEKSFSMVGTIIETLTARQHAVSV